MKLIVFDVSGTLHEDRLGAPMYEDLKLVLESLKAQGVNIALATNLSRSGLDRFINNNQIKHLLDVHLTLSEAPAKPHPKMLEEIILQTGCIFKDTLMVGDSVNDIYMAHQLNIKACAVAWEGGFSTGILNEKPEYKVESVGELCQILSTFTGKKITI